MANELATLDDSQILDQIAGGQFAAQIATELGISKQALQQRLKANPNYRAAMETGAETQLQDTIGSFDVASAPLDLARARDKFKAISWYCEREFPARWGNKSTLDVNVTHDLGSRLRDARERMKAIAPQQTGQIAQEISTIDVTPCIVTNHDVT